MSSTFFPTTLLKAAMTEYGDKQKTDDPLKVLKKRYVSPFLIKIEKD